MESEKLLKRHVGLPLTLLILYLMVIASFLLEHVGKHKLSTLCFAQRYCMVFCLIFVTFAFLSRNKMYKKLMDFSCISLCLGAIISFYHLLVQNRILPEPGFCKGRLPVNISISDMEKIVRDNEIASCANIGPNFLGISFDAVVFIIFLFLFIYLTTCFRESSGEETKK